MKKSLGERIFNVFNIAVITILCLIMVLPYINQLALSLNDGSDSMKGGFILFPRIFTIDNFKTILRNSRFVNSFFISVSRVVISTVLALFVDFAAAYGLTRRGLPYKRGMTLYLMIPMYISAGTIPTYILYRYYHLINSYLVYVIPGVFSFYNMVIIRSFLQEFPEAVVESAKIDGAGDWKIMFRIVFPLSLPVVATVALWCAVGAWNDWTTTLLYITDESLYTLQYMMMKLVKESEVARQMAMEAAMENSDVKVSTTPESVKSATLIVSTLPIILVYPFLQKYFIKGVTLGAVKG